MNDDEVLIPAETDNLLDLLEGMYRPEEVVDLVLEGRGEEAFSLASKIQLIREIREIREEQKGGTS